MVGLPATGKTTFLAALWHVVESAEVDGSLKLKKLEGNRDYVSGIRNEWLGCRQLDRTTIGVERIVSMLLEESSGARDTEVLFPDMSGETFNAQWNDRKWSATYEGLVDGATGALVFVHPEGVEEPYRIDTANGLAAQLDDRATASLESPAEECIPWDPDKAPTQVKVVELLQFLTLRRGSDPVFRIGVVVSAWDLVQGEGKSPSEWLADRLPLFDQYLRANREHFHPRVYGISAQGGDLNQEGERLRGYTRASERIMVEGEDCAPHDITAPVKWAMG